MTYNHNWWLIYKDSTNRAKPSLGRLQAVPILFR